MPDWNSVSRWLQLRWIGPSRLRAYAIILLFVSVVSFWEAYREATGSPGSDFLAFWSAARLAVSGSADRVYDLAATGGVQATVGRLNVFAFVNPPPFLLVVAPFGLMGYRQAWASWIVITYLVWFLASRRRDPSLSWQVAAFPGALIAGWHAQTGLLTGALMAAAADRLRSQPVLAGACIGALVIKPHLALLFPVALAAGRHWRAFWSAGATVILLFLLTALVFGTGPFVNYPKSWAVSRYLVETGDADFFLRQSTVYAAIRVFASPFVATAAQAMVSLIVVAATWRVWAGGATLDGKLAFLMAAIPLATPYAFSYDLAFLIIPVVWLAGEVRRSPRGQWERPLVMFLYFSPFLARVFAMPLGINLAPWVQMVMLWAVWRRLAVTSVYQPAARQPAR